MAAELPPFHRSEQLVHRIESSAADGSTPTRHGNHPNQRPCAGMVANRRDSRCEEWAQLVSQFWDVVILIGVEDPPEHPLVCP